MIKNFIKDIMPPILINIFRKEHSKEVIINDLINTYIANGRKHYGVGYDQYKNSFIEKSLNNIDLLKKFKNAQQLDDNFGYRLDDRVVEYPLIFSMIEKSDKNILDAGSTFNNELIINNEKLSGKNLHIHTYFPESVNFVSKRVSYGFGDLRDTPYKNNFFDFISSISTIEHISMDNTIYGYSDENKNNGNKNYDYLNAIKEFIRILKVGGKFIVTFPYGAYKNYGFFQQFDNEMVKKIQSLCEEYGHFELRFYRYHMDGWRLANQEECEDLVSHNPHTGEGKGKDGAAHSRANCSIIFQKKL